MELEQTTLSQFFTTRKKGLQGVHHPAKRRKVEESEQLANEVAVRRSTRSKTRKQASISQTKIKTSRAGKGTTIAAKKSVDEENFQPPCKSVLRVVSEPTSLFDDHAFAEALCGKLEAAQRKRKMASLGCTDASMSNDVSKNVSSLEAKQEKVENSRDSTRPKSSRRRVAKGTKPASEESKDTNKESSGPSEQGSLPVDSVVEPTLHLNDAPTEKGVIASPSKTPPAVRRIAGGVAANPWIAEQARVVLSRGKTAVNLSQKAKSGPGEKHKTAVKKDVGSGVAAGNALNRAQEDLVKARKLIKTMRSLEKSASKPAQLSTEDNSQRLHQLASPNKNKSKEAVQSTKEAPAYERFHALAQPSPSEASTATLPLPYKYKLLAEMFRCTDTVLNLLGQRKEKCTFTKLRDAVQQMSRKRFEKKHLAQMATTYPSALEFRQDRCIGKSSSFELTIQFGKTDEVQSKLKLTAPELLARKDAFQKNLLQLTKKHHQDFLLGLNPSISVDKDKILRWHPKFHLDDIPDIEEAPLPQPPVVKTYSTAHDVLEKARDMIAPRVEKALRNVAKEKEEREQEIMNKEKNVPENKDTAKTENTQHKNNSRNKPALKGISQDLLNKIRQKEAKKIEETMMRDPIVDKKLAMKERLPDLCRILKAYFSTERKAAIPLEDASVKLAESYKTSLSAVQVEEHLRLVSQLVPEWMSILTVRKCSYVKINKTADVNNVVNKLVAVKIH